MDNKQRMSFKHSVLNGMSSLNFFLQCFGNYVCEEGKVCKQLRGWKTPRKECLPYTTGLVHKGVHRASDIIYMACMCTRQKSRQCLSLGKEKWTQVLIPKLSIYLNAICYFQLTSTCKKKNQLILSNGVSLLY